MIHYLTIGVLLGLSAGMAPGPLLTLVVSETLAQDVRAGLKVAVAPLITDFPIIFLTVFILSRLSGFHTILGIISLVGGGLVFMMGIHGIQSQGARLEIQKTRSQSLLKGILVNVLSPHPYLFWLSVGAPILTRARQENLIFVLVFLTSFYFLLVGVKIALAVLVGKSKSLLTGRTYIYLNRCLGFFLMGLSIFLFKDGLTLLGIIS